MFLHTDIRVALICSSNSLQDSWKRSSHNQTTPLKFKFNLKVYGFETLKTNIKTYLKSKIIIRMWTATHCEIEKIKERRKNNRKFFIGYLDFLDLDFQPTSPLPQKSHRFGLQSSSTISVCFKSLHLVRPIQTTGFLQWCYKNKQWESTVFDVQTVIQWYKHI